MRIGLSAYNITATDLMDLAVAADELGFSSIWLGEHIVLPIEYGSEHPTSGKAAHKHHKGPIVDPDTILVDPLVALSAAAARTQQIELATGIYILPMRPPLITARMTATLADVSGGRFVLGVGSGWLEEEFDAIGVPFAERGPRFDESIDILRASWSGETFRHEGRFWNTGLVQMSKTPVPVPLILGGNTERALKRAAVKADGWFSSGTPALEESIAYRARLLELREEAGLDAPYRITVRAATATEAELAPYRDAEFTEALIWADQVWPAEGDLDHKRSALAEAAARLGVTPSTK